MYADNIVLLSPSATGLSLLLHVCGKYGLEHDIRFNSKKSVVIIFRNSFVKDFSYPSFVMNGESNEVPFVKYIGHVINDDMKDDLDMGHFHKKGQITVKTWRSIFNPVATRYLCISIDIYMPCDTYVL